MSENLKQMVSAAFLFFLQDPKVLVLASHLLHDGCQPSQGQAAFITTGDHGTAELDYDPLGMTQFTAVCKGATTGFPLGNCTYREKVV